ncbi:glucosamine-6-phosphate deaminase [Actinomycetes bacterium NPDC127524]
MKTIIVKDYEEMSQKAAGYIIKKVRENPKLTLGLATGGTPVGTYRNLIEDHEKNGTSYKHATTFNLDEYVGLPQENPQSYRSFMDDNLFNHIDIIKTETHVPSGNKETLHTECEKYEKLLSDHGGVDLQLLGIGGNGHIGFNEPGTSFDSKTHIVDLAPSTIEANSRFFDSEQEVPTQAITMGIQTIMNSREILLIVSGESKREALSQLLNGEEVSESFPASVLRNHPCVTIIADESASANIKYGI